MTSDQSNPKLKDQRPNHTTRQCSFAQAAHIFNCVKAICKYPLYSYLKKPQQSKLLLTFKCLNGKADHTLWTLEEGQKSSSFPLPKRKSKIDCFFSSFLRHRRNSWP